MTTGGMELSRQLLLEAAHLLEFGASARLSQGGFGWLGTTGMPMTGRPRMLYVTCRMTHTYSLATLAGQAGARDLVAHGLAALHGPFRDRQYGGWFTAIDEHTGEPVQDQKWAYPHAFVILAASSATIAGVPRARALLDEALDVFTTRFWDEEYGGPREEWDRTFSTLSPYRGANSSMHSVEALLAAADATGDDSWAHKARRISERMIRSAQAHGWRLPEHYDSRWHPDLEHNAGNRDDPFKPYGAQPGHSFEWARLLMHVDRGSRTLVNAAEHLFHQAVKDAWAVDGQVGLIYTVDWAGVPIVRSRLHWAVCEAIAASAELGRTVQSLEYLTWMERFWRYAQEHHMDDDSGSWHHELGPDLTPTTAIRPGKADIYHAVQACLLPSLPPARSLAAGVAASGLRLPDADPSRWARRGQD